MKTRLSNWKEESDLFEVVTGKMTDKEALKKVSEKKGIQNKVKQQTGKNNLTYKFINAYPIAISSMPLSYDSSSVLKCTVSFTYIRYLIENLDKDLTPLSNS